MRFVLLLLLAACKGGSGHDSDPAASDDFGLWWFDGLPERGTLTMRGFNHPLHVAVGDVLVTIGISDSGSNRYMLTALRGDEVAWAWQRAFVYADFTHDARPGAIVGDGEGGVLVSASAFTATTGLPEALLARVDANGELVWSKGYASDPGGPYWGLPSQSGPSPSTWPDAAVGEPVAGRVPVVGGGTVMVVDVATGEALWARIGTGSAHQIASDADGFTVYGHHYEDLVIWRFGWDGTLLWARRSVGAITPGSNTALHRPHVRADGTVWLPYEVLDGGDVLDHSGILALSAEGELLDHWGYEVRATYTSSVGGTIDDTSRQAAMPISDDAVAIQRYVYLEYPEDRYQPVVITVRVADDGAPDDGVWSWSERPYERLANGQVATLWSARAAVGSLGAECSHDFLALGGITRTTERLEPVASFADDTPVFSDFPVTVHDEPIELTDLAIGEAQPLNSTCPNNPG